MEKKREDYKNQVKKSRKFRVLKTTGLLFLALFIVSGAGVGYFFNKMANLTASAQQELERGEHSEKRAQPINPNKDNFSVLFLGLDDRDGSLKGRTDALLLATFNKDEGTIKMISIPRDSRVEIPGRVNLDKINHAHAFGGLDMTIATVENLFDIPIDYFVKLNFDAFIEVIDALGGIEVEVPFTFEEMDSIDQKSAITLNEGLQNLNGEEVLAFARMRKKDPRGDIGRGERQQQVLAAIIKKGASFSTLTKFDDVLASIETNLATNLSFGNILSLHSYSSGLKDIESLSLKGNDLTHNRIYYYELEEDSVADISATLRNHLGIEFQLSNAN